MDLPCRRRDLISCLAAAALCALPAGGATAAEPVDYVRDVKPILKVQCYACHGSREQKGKLRLDTVQFALKGGRSGPALVPGKSADSLLIEKVALGTSPKRMPPPPKACLPDKDIGLLKAWIDQGAKAPEKEAPDDPRNHWAFQALKRPPLPAVKNEAWCRNPIDRFILARLEKEGLAPSAEADRITLVRRLSLDLTGLPPLPEEVNAALQDKSDNWYDKVVDRLLASPHYGERWGRIWLDQARYADSHGYTIDAARSIWKYRDWAIDSLNQDKPFDQFTIEQLAGDLLPNATVEQKMATGFHRNTQINQEGGIDVEQFRVESVVDRVNTTGSVWLGLTVGCCQCHDHKFDPLTQKEYYQLFAFLNNQDEPTLELPTPEQLARRTQLRTRIAGVEKELRTLDIAPADKERDWEKKLTATDWLTFPDEIVRTLNLAVSSRDNKQKQALTAFYLRANHVPHAMGGLGDPLPFLGLAHAQADLGRATLDQTRAELRKLENEVVTTMVLRERPTPRVTTLMIQGDFTRKGAEVKAGVPAVLNPLKTPGISRLELARWVVDPANPLTSRVAVNRFWMHHFGTGIVETENDFGTQGTPPSHPELLDWLAAEFMASEASGGRKSPGEESAWSMKKIHRLLVTSATYRQSSNARPELATVDARNRLLARQNRLRLDAELVRDGALTASGLLTRKIGGPSVFPPQPEGVYKFTQLQKDWKVSTGPDRYRRGMYTYFWRSAPHPGLTVFDAPDASTTCTRRNRSNTPLQALTLLNDQAYVEFAQALAARVLKEAKPDDTERIRRAFQLCVARLPSAKEEVRIGQLLKQQLASFRENPEQVQSLVPQAASKAEAEQLAAWTMVARALLNLDEFITRE
jgi:mono/diheme cytochrome c family protein